MLNNKNNREPNISIQTIRLNKNEQAKFLMLSWLAGWFMVFKVTFNNISAISWWSVLLVKETRVPGEVIEIPDFSEDDKFLECRKNCAYNFPVRFLYLCMLQ
jgi:hypothetical protein